MALTPDQIALIHRTMMASATADELATFIERCDRTQLDPFARQIYPQDRWSKKENRNTWQTQVSIDGFRLVAERSGHYAGQAGPFWCGTDGTWRDVWLSEVPPSAAKVAVLRHDFIEPLVAVATWPQYVQTTQDGKPTMMWRRMPALMLAKCAEALALRRAFPQELSGLYTADEMAQATVADADTPPPAATSPEPDPPAAKKAAPKSAPIPRGATPLAADDPGVLYTTREQLVTDITHSLVTSLKGTLRAYLKLDHDATQEEAEAPVGMIVNGILTETYPAGAKSFPAEILGDIGRETIARIKVRVTEMQESKALRASAAEEKRRGFGEGIEP